MSRAEDAPPTASVLDPRRFVFVVVLALLALTLDVIGLDLWGAETVSDAMTTFVVMAIGGYAGLTVADVGWKRVFGN